MTGHRPGPPATSCQRWRERRGAWRPAGELIEPRRYTVATIERTLGRRFVEQHHYAGSYVASVLDVGLFDGAELVGVAAFSVGVQPAALGRWCGVAVDEGVDLGRFVLRDDVPGNGESWFLARAFRELRRERPAARAVLSYSDPQARETADGRVVTPGHVGTIYQAFGGRYLGRAAPRSCWLTPDGRLLAPRTLDKVRRGERGHAAAVDRMVRLGAPAPRLGEALGAWLDRALVEGPFRRLRHPGNHVYAWPVAEGAALASALPYPKRALAQGRAA